MTTRDDHILEHVGLYRLTFRRVLDRVFFAGHSSSNVLDRLMRTGKLTPYRLGGGPLCYYQLSKAEAASRGIPHRALPLGGQALPEAIAVLWFCLLSKADGLRRYRLEASELEELFGASAPRGPHCLEDATPARLWRIYAPGPRTKLAAITRAVEALLERSERHPTVAPWLRNGLYGIAVLSSTDVRRNRIREALHSLGHRSAAVLTDFAPDPHSIQRALHELEPLRP